MGMKPFAASIRGQQTCSENFLSCGGDFWVWFGEENDFGFMGELVTAIDRKLHRFYAERPCLNAENK